MVGKIGFNSAGLGMTCNLLITDRDRRDVGIPMHVLLRKILNDAETLGEAIGLIGKAERASSLNYLLAHRDGAAMDVEGAPEAFDVLAPEGGRIAHTNHFVGPRLAVKDLSWTVVPDSYVRLWRARTLLREKGDRLGLKDLQEIFRDHVNRPDSICRHADLRDQEADRMETLASLIIDLDEQTLHITCGTPCSNEYRTLNFG
jgi:isopenicillin-N N-acyltransferase-like protein